MVETALVKLTEAEEQLAEELKAIVVECVAQSKWELVQGHWNVGRLLRTEYLQEGITKSLQVLAVRSGLSERTLWNDLAIYDKWQDINRIPEGKAISYNKIIQIYLPKDGRKNLPEPIKYSVVRCTTCGKLKLKAGEDLICHC